MSAVALIKSVSSPCSKISTIWLIVFSFFYIYKYVYALLVFAFIYSDSSCQFFFSFKGKKGVVPLSLGKTTLLI